MANIGFLKNVISIINDSTFKPELYLTIQHNIASNLQQSTKLLYDLTKEKCQKTANALPELFIQDLDDEQIWQQIELQNEDALTSFLTNVSKVLAGKNNLKVPISLITKQTYSRIVNNKSLSDNELINENADKSQKRKNDELELDSDDQVDIVQKKQKKVIIKSKKQADTSVVDDKFFKLQELREYLTKEEKKEQYLKEKDSSSDEESVDLFDDFFEEEGEEDADNVKYVKYADFFDNPESEDDKESREDNFNNENKDYESKNKECEFLSKTMLHPFKKKIKFNLSNDSDNTDSNEIKGDESKDAEAMSSFKEREERLKKKIQQLEEENLAEKPWQLRGQVNVANRPENALLEEYLEVEMTSRPAPVMTEKTALKLEDIIRTRIKDKAWDDVVKKFKPVETPLEYKKQLLLDQEKSKQSLAEIYENEYLKQKKALNPDKTEEVTEEPREHIEIREMIHSLFMKLDALSNFHCTPKPTKPEIKIINNVPAINVEEVAPVATSDATLLAPEEVKAKPHGDLIGQTERTKRDIKRARRHKKLCQSQIQKTKKNREKMKMEKTHNRLEKEKLSLTLTKQITKARNIRKVDETGHKVGKSSKTFFEQLQDQVKTSIRSKTAAKVKKEKNAVSAVKLKL